MPRPLRPPIENGFYHVTSRGNRRCEIYCDSADKKYFLGLLADVVERFGWLLHAYCLMTNHYHLVVRTPLANISRGMQRLNSMHASWFNWRHGCSGHLFQGRFHTVDVEDQSHFIELARYVVLNPVRAGITDHPAGYSWSSYRSTVGSASRPSFLASDAILEEFGPNLEDAQAAYASFVKAGIGEAVHVRSGHVRGQTRDVVLRAMAAQPNPYVPGKRSASSPTSSDAGSPTTFR
jgi:REP element-mobilizing transposase RayT